MNQINSFATEPLGLSSLCMRSGKSHIGYSLLRDAVRSGMDFDVAYKKIFNTEVPTKMFVSFEYLNPEQERRILEMIPEYVKSNTLNSAERSQKHEF